MFSIIQTLVKFRDLADLINGYNPSANNTISYDLQEGFGKHCYKGEFITDNHHFFLSTQCCEPC